MAKILLIEDDVAFCKLLEKFLIKKTFDVTTAFSAAEAKSNLKSTEFDLIITDLRLPDYDGITLMSEIKMTHPTIPILLMTGYADVSTAVKAIKNGAADYISKPFNPEEVLLVINNALQIADDKGPLKTSSIVKSEKKGVKINPNKFVKGISKASLKLAEHIQLVSPTTMSVLIIGESGTGKEVIAKSIHENSSRKNTNFIAVDCGSIPK
ncbi:DNA-binding NtrC family response regulator [Flavobacterium sp. CG_9.1]|nr:DNA-binding NtrC family response regulator [Flavobacterium sp. CG_9.1]